MTFELLKVCRNKPFFRQDFQDLPDHCITYLSSLALSACESRFKASNHVFMPTPIILTLTQKSTNWKIFSKGMAMC
jgi:hypothetical protein